MPDLAGLSALAYGTYGTVDPYAASGYGASAAAYTQQGMALGMTATNVMDPHQSLAYVNTMSSIIPTVTSTATTATTTTTQSTDQVDPTSYYPDFWNYAAYYGEAAARAYYTVWSPPVGTPPPEGITLPVYSTDSQQSQLSQSQQSQSQNGSNGAQETAILTTETTTAINSSSSSLHAVDDVTASNTNTNTLNDSTPIVSTTSNADPANDAANAAYQQQYAEWFAQQAQSNLGSNENVTQTEASENVSSESNNS